MKTGEQIKQGYHEQVEAIAAQLGQLHARGRGFVTGEIASFLGFVAFIAFITISDTELLKLAEGLLAAAMAVLYIVIRNKDVKNSERITEAEQRQQVYRNEVAALSGDFSSFDDGERYIDPHHPFTFDMDIFGKDSLYQRINRTVTTCGADRLAECLSRVDIHKNAREIDDYRNAINTLAAEDDTDWRIRFISSGVSAKIETNAILLSLPELQRIAIPGMLHGKGIKILACTLSAGAFVSIIAAVYRLVSPMLPITWIFVNFFLVAGMAGKYLNAMLAVGNRLHNEMQPLMRVVRLITAMDRDGIRNIEILARDVNTLREAADSFEILTDIVETLILRTNDAYKFFADAFCLRGFFLVEKFSHWRTLASANLTQWIEAVSEMDMLVSMAQMRYNHPEAGAATIKSEEEVTILYEANGLWHPFLGAKAVRNDFTIRDGNFYIITGANMAGKSTFLRAIGVNYILAMNGMPVFAEHLCVSCFKLFSSMRTSDDLSHGVSYFNAELKRLEQLLDYIKQPTLLILDEILKGTNSLDKLNGSRLFLHAIAHKPVAGLIATHDLELSKMEQENTRFHNWCFEIALKTNVAYPYKITQGVARNQNATFLLEKILNGQRP